MSEPRGPTTEAPGVTVSPLADYLSSYYAVVGTRTWRGVSRPVHGTRYVAHCRCGAWALAGGDYITTIRAARGHKRGCPA